MKKTRPRADTPQAGVQESTLIIALVANATFRSQMESLTITLVSAGLRLQYATQGCGLGQFTTACSGNVAAVVRAG
jgi:hypothetical protein